MIAPAHQNDLTVLDWIGAAFVLSAISLLVIAVPLHWAPSFAAMFEDFGGELPALTQLILAGWFPVVWGIVSALVLALPFGPFRGAPVLKRRLMIAGAFLLAAGGVLLCIAGFYAPIFSLASAIQ